MTTPPVSIELRHLRYFLAVFEELHFGRAAARLHMAQPPLSYAIRKLEDELGVTLLRRTSRVVTPTDAGRAFADEARKVLANVDLAIADARRAGDAGSVVRLSCVPTLPLTHLLRFLGALSSRLPTAHARVTHLPAVEQVRRLREGELELGLFHHGTDHAELELEPIFPGEPLAAYLPPDHHLASKSALGPRELVDEPLVTTPQATDPALHDRLLTLLKRAGYDPRRVRDADGPDPRDVLLAVAGGLGIGLLPSALPEVDETDALVVRRPLQPGIILPDIVLAWRRNPAPPLRSAIAALRSAARELRRAETAA
jgi:DNA-binding transcriptional LysR family regulator